jgi:hypothetical protein
MRQMGEDFRARRNLRALKGSAVPGARGCRTATHLRGRRCQRLVAVSGRVRHGDVRMHRERKRERGGKPGRNELPETRGDPKLCLKLVQFLEFSRSHFSSRCCSCSGPQGGPKRGAAASPAPLLIYSLRMAPRRIGGPALGSHSDYRRSRSCSSIARSGLTKSLHPQRQPRERRPCALPRAMSSFFGNATEIFAGAASANGCARFRCPFRSTLSPRSRSNAMRTAPRTARHAL